MAEESDLNECCEGDDRDQYGVVEDHLFGIEDLEQKQHDAEGLGSSNDGHGDAKGLHGTSSYHRLA